MNCFEARKEFPSFWRRTMTPQARAAFLGHVSKCVRCDHAFRIFALTAPVLYSESEPGAPGRVSQPRVAALESSLSARRSATLTGSVVAQRPWRAGWAAAAMAAAAMLAVYIVSATPRQTFENAIAGDDSTAEATTPVGGLLGEALSDQDTLAQDPLTQPNNRTNSFAGFAG